MKYKVTTDKLASWDKGDIIDDQIVIGNSYRDESIKDIIERNPDWFQPIEQVKEGQYWAWDENDTVFRIQKVDERICEVRPLYQDYNGRTLKRDIINEARKLSTDKIKEVLIEEAKRREIFDQGTSVIDVDGDRFDVGFCVNYAENNDFLEKGMAILYRRGRWAEPVDQTPHIEINGKQIEVEGGTVKISCGDTVSEEMYKNFYAVVNKYDLNVSRNGEQINEQLQQIWDEMPQRTIGCTLEIGDNGGIYRAAQRGNLRF